MVGHPVVSLSVLGKISRFILAHISPRLLTTPFIANRFMQTIPFKHFINEHTFGRIFLYTLWVNIELDPRIALSVDDITAAAIALSPDKTNTSW